MSVKCEQQTCPFGMVYEVEMKNLTEDFREMKDRVRNLETTLARGVMLLIANLVAVSLSLFQQLYHF